MNTPEKESNSFLAPVSADQGGDMMAATASRAAAEVQAAMVIAKKFPRNEIQCIERIKVACQRMALAESAMYSYPRGGQTVTGPSIRLAEVLAKSWGNIDCGVVELTQQDGESVVLSYAWDLETNARSTKVFTVKHERSARGEIKKLTDPRDIYEMTANQGARRLRACILSIIPIDVQEAAIEQCEKTLQGDGKEPLKDRVTKMVIAFKEQFGVTQDSIEKRIGHKAEVISEQELVGLRKIYTSLRDNMAKREDFFPDMGNPVESSKPKTPDRKNEAPTTSQSAPASTPAGLQNNPAGTPERVTTTPTEPPPTGKDVLYDAENPVASLASMMKRDGLTDHQVVAYAKSLGLAGKSVAKANEIREANIKKLCETWSQHLNAIKVLPAA
jgi:hypothetical protein